MPHMSSVSRQESTMTENPTQGFTPRGKKYFEIIV